MKTAVTRAPISSSVSDVELPLSESSVPGRASVWLMGCLGFAVALLVALAVPLGASEAAALDWLRAATAAGWGEPFRHPVARGWTGNQPMTALTLAALLAKVSPPLGVLCALRLPDVLAAGLVTGALVRLARAPAAGVLAGLVFIASPMLWAGAVGPPGLIVDSALGILLYGAVLRGQVQRSAAGLVGALIAIALLVANHAGLYATAIVGGLYLHRGLACGEWRLAGSLRLTVLAWLVLAGLTLTSAFDLPSLGRGADLIDGFGRAAADNGLRVAGMPIIALLVGVSLVAQIATLARPANPRGGQLLILILGVAVLLTAATTPVGAIATLAPVLALWWASPLARVAPSAAGAAVGGVYALLILAATAGLLILGRTLPVDASGMVWAGRVVAGVFGLAALGLLWRLRRGGSSAAPAAAALVAFIVAGSIWLVPPQRLFPQRGFDAQLARTLTSFGNRPIAVVAPVDPRLWRAELARPVFTAADVNALCHWAAGQAGGAQKPLALVRPGATDAVTGRFGNARLVAQSAGSPRTSVMVIELPDSSGRECR